MKTKLVVLSHTHWDREWHLPFQEFRWKLVQLMDELLDVLAQHQAPSRNSVSPRAHSEQGDFGETSPTPRSGDAPVTPFRCFMLDGQTILLEDYLELRPGRRMELEQGISSGRILVGPWYVLPDEFLVSGEAIIRNLLLGDAVAREFGEPMRVGYLPDQFGHISQMPQILRGFGLDSAVIWRGVGDELRRTEFAWRAPDGTEVLTLHLPGGYFNGQMLPLDASRFIEHIAKIREKLEARTQTGHVVIMNGGDHQFVQVGLPAILAAAAAQIADAELSHSCLPQVMEEIRRSIAGSGAILPVLESELRNCKLAHLLPGVLSSRMWIKQRNVACENLLEKWAEPFSAWAALEESSGEQHRTRKCSGLDHANLHAGLTLAWKYLLQNQPHDSICGCSIDQVHDEMIARFNWSEGIAEGLVEQALGRIVAHVNTAAPLPTEANSESAPQTRGESYPSPRDRRDEGDSEPRTDNGGTNCVVVFNPVEGPRTDFVSFRATDLNGERFAVVDDRGVFYPCQVLQRRTNPITGQPEVDLGFLAHEVPAFGYRTLRLVSDATSASPATARSDTAGTAGVPHLSRHYPTTFVENAYHETFIGGNRIENEHFSIDVDAEDGTLLVLDKLAGYSYKGLNLFVDGGDAGDEYNYDAPLHDTLVSPDEAPLLSVTESGPCRFTLKIGLTLSVPAQLKSDRRSRKEELVKLPVTSFVTLYPGVRRIDIRTEVDNLAEDHRLRVHFPTGIHSDFAHADGHFTIERRPVDVPVHSLDWIEDPVGTQPQKAFVDVSDETRGLMVVNRGLPEYEALRSKDGVVIALTLLRCIGWLSRDDLHSRRGPAGPVILATGGQCPGRHTFDYSLIPHLSGWAEAFLGARQFNNPMRVQPTTTHSGHLPWRLSFVKVEPDDLVISAVKPAEDGNGLIVRIYNPTPRTVRGAIFLYRQFVRAESVNLREEPLNLLAEERSEVTLDIAQHQIVSVRFTF
ncbi:MAG: hypothetical protein HYY30_01660 [Chloroflexi bacterium]|nr:hypothetical protein [Chloroflexota bacterium]